MPVLAFCARPLRRDGRVTRRIACETREKARGRTGGHRSLKAAELEGVFILSGYKYSGLVLRSPRARMVLEGEFWARSPTLILWHSPNEANSPTLFFRVVLNGGAHQVRFCAGAPGQGSVDASWTALFVPLCGQDSRVDWPCRALRVLR